jgi:hypothetical protein
MDSHQLTTRPRCASSSCHGFSLQGSGQSRWKVATSHRLAILVNLIHGEVNIGKPKKERSGSPRDWPGSNRRSAPSQTDDCCTRQMGEGECARDAQRGHPPTGRARPGGGKAGIATMSDRTKLRAWAGRHQLVEPTPAKPEGVSRRRIVPTGYNTSASAGVGGSESLPPTRPRLRGHHPGHNLEPWDERAQA